MVERERYVGWAPTELAGPHGVAVSPDKKHYFVSTAHGTPFGRLQKYNAETNAAEGSVMLGNFPATAQVSPNGYYVYVVNFNLHGDMVTSDVSVVAADEMVEIARIPTCTMPHGSRLNGDGTQHYSACMMDEMLVEIDTRTLAVSRHFLAHEGQGDGNDRRAAVAEVPTRTSRWRDMTWAGMAWSRRSRATSRARRRGRSRRPTARAFGWRATSRARSSRSTRRRGRSCVAFPLGPGVYNLGLTHDGKKLIGTNKRDQSVSVIDIATGKELARIPTTRKVVHGVAVSDDDRYAFISVEGSGSQPGTVDVIDLASLAKVASVDVGQQAGGIDFWKSEAVRP